MPTAEQKAAYERYLTERLDSGQSNNIVIPTTADLIRKKPATTEGVYVLDIGCFSGAMLNRIRNEISCDIQNVTRFVGIDTDKDTLEIGRKRYRDLDLRQADLMTSLNHLEKFDVVVMANVLHETLGGSTSKQGVETTIKGILEKVVGLLKNQGNLVILDGLKPPGEDNRIVINFKTTEAKNLFIEFALKYNAFPVEIRADDSSLTTRVKDLAAFLTKARYLHENYWPIESTQNYQYFTLDQFEKVLKSCGMSIERIEPQRFTEENLGAIFESVEPQIDFPAKNVLIVARKND